MGSQDRVNKRFNDEPTLPGTVWAQSPSTLLYHYTVIYTRLVSHQHSQDSDPHSYSHKRSNVY